MAYTDVISLATAKTYLRIDDSQNETDSEITSMIKSALSYVEKHTNVLVYDRSKTYPVYQRCVRVYDYPINSVTKAVDDDGVDITLTYKTNYTYTTKNFYTLYEQIDSDAVSLVLNVGYDDPADVPTELIDVALVIIKLMYYEQESDKSFTDMIPSWAKHILETNRRHII